MDADHRTALAERLAALPAFSGVAVVWQPAHINQAAPLLVLRLVSDRRGIAHDGDDGLRDARLQLDAYAATDADAQAIRAVVLEDLHAFSGPLTTGGPELEYCTHENSFDDFDEPTGLVRAGAELLVQYHPFSPVP
jgi:hypothetical protein